MNPDYEFHEARDENDSDATDLEELEIALYGQIHHEQNSALDDSFNLAHLFEVEERNTGETEGDSKETECIHFGGKTSQRLILNSSTSEIKTVINSEHEAKVTPLEKPKKKKKKKDDKPMKAKKTKNPDDEPIKAKKTKIAADKPIKAKKTKIAADKPIKAKKTKIAADKPIKAKTTKIDDDESMFIPYVDSDVEEIIVTDGTDQEEIVISDSNDEITLPTVRSNILLDCDDIKDLDIAAIHDRMPDVGWDIVEKDREVESRNRYYTAFNVRCHNCDEKGHLSKSCPRPKKLSTCCLCSKLGHTSRTCPNKLCFNCSKPGHSSHSCSKPRRRNYDECHRCGSYGHMKHECPDLWRQFHLTIHGSGYPPTTVPKVENKRVFCYNCAKKGHFGHECDKEFMDKFRNIQVPFIARYDTSRPHHGTKRKFDDYDDNSQQPHKRKRFDNSGNTGNDNYQRQNSSGTSKKQRQTFVGDTSQYKRNPWNSTEVPKYNSYAKNIEKKMSKKKKPTRQDWSRGNDEILHQFNSYARNNEKKLNSKKRKNQLDDFPRGRYDSSVQNKWRDSDKKKNGKNKKRQQVVVPVDDSVWWNKGKKKRCKKGK